MAELVTQRSALAPALVDALREALLKSPYLAHSTLAGSFRGTRGFAITFTADGRAALEQRFPFLRDYLRLVLDPVAAARLEPWWRRSRALATARQPNAFYLNLLLLSEQARIGRHVDATLRGPTGEATLVPQRVGVLYLSAPAKRGGELRLFRNQRLRGAVRPRPGLLLLFRGDLEHEVTPMLDAQPDDLRASLVCEQYRLTPTALERLAPITVQSKAGFEAYLSGRAGEPTAR